jgi:DNA-binding NtrC family response regulator
VGTARILGLPHMSQEAPNIITPQTPCILVVEDSRVDRELISLLLSGSGYEVIGAGRLSEAITQLKSRTPDLIVLDEQLPDGRSSERLDTIRALSPQTPLVFVSGQLDLATALAISQRSVAAIFNKPVNPKALVGKIRELVEFHFSSRADQGTKKETTVPDPPKSSASPFPATAMAPDSTRTDSTRSDSGARFRWNAFPGSGQEHTKLAQRLTKVCDFRTTLLVLGPIGCAFLPITRDLHANSKLHQSPLYFFTPERFKRAEINARLAAHLTTNDCLTFALKRIDLHDAEQSALLTDLLDFRREFSPFAGRIRFLLSAVPSFLDAAHSSAHSHDLIERAAGLTVEVAPLSAFRDDLTTIARQVLKETGVSVTNLGADVVDWLETKTWPGEFCQFRRVLLLAHAANSTLNAEMLESAYDLEPTLPADAYECSLSHSDAPVSTAKPSRPAPPALATVTSPAPADPTPVEPSFTPPTTPSAPPPATVPKRRQRIGAYDFASRLQSSLTAEADASAPDTPIHPRFATEKK